MDNEIYEYILSRVGEDLKPYGYKRSGKGTLFYCYSADRKVGCAIEMQKSIFNTPESHSFTFNFVCVALYDLPNYSKEKLTLDAIKIALANPYIGGERIGILCRGTDYWWEFTGDKPKKLKIEKYYNRFIHNDIVNTACYLKEVAEKKEQIYKQ